MDMNTHAALFIVKIYEPSVSCGMAEAARFIKPVRLRFGCSIIYNIYLLSKNITVAVGIS